MKTNRSTKGAMLTQEYLKEVFEYKDGKLYRKVATSTNVKVGDVVGTSTHNGYLRTRVNNKDYFVHKLIFTMLRGHSVSMIDHIDGNKLNNNIENLRAVSRSQNGLNAKRSRSNTTGFKNVVWNSQKNCFQVKFSVKGKSKHFGYFEDLELAALVAEEARNKYHGEFARHQ